MLEFRMRRLLKLLNVLVGAVIFYIFAIALLYQ